MYEITPHIIYQQVTKDIWISHTVQEKIENYTRERLLTKTVFKEPLVVGTNI